MVAGIKKEPTLKVDSEKIVTGIKAKFKTIHPLECQTLNRITVRDALIEKHQ